MTKATYLIDTNILLHCKNFNQIEWPEFLKENILDLRIPAVILGELDTHKDQNPNIRIRRRAQEVSNIIDDLFGDNLECTLAENLTITLELNEPLTTDIQFGFTASKKDDLLLSRGIELKRATPNIQVGIISNDTLCRRRAMMAGLVAVKPPASVTLNLEPDEHEQKIKALERQLLDLQNRQPNFYLHSVAGGRIAQFPYLQNPSLLDVEDELYELATLYPQLSRPPLQLNPNSKQPNFLSSLAAVAETISRPSEYDYEFYNKQRTEFLAKSRRYLIEFNEFQEKRSRTVALNFIHGNDGGGAAANIDVILDFPEYIRPLLECPFDEPFRPEPPEKPQSLIKQLQNPVAVHHILGIQQDRMSSRLAQLIPRQSDPTPLRIKGLTAENNRVNYHIPLLKQNQKLEIPTIYIEFESIDSAKSFELQYTVNCPERKIDSIGKISIVFGEENLQPKQSL